MKTLAVSLDVLMRDIVVSSERGLVAGEVDARLKRACYTLRILLRRVDELEGGSGSRSQMSFRENQPSA